MMHGHLNVKKEKNLFSVLKLVMHFRLVGQDVTETAATFSGGIGIYDEKDLNKVF